jgi:hypothetical protein
MLTCNLPTQFPLNYYKITNHSKVKKDSSRKLLSFIADQAGFMIKKMIERQRSTFYMKLEDQKLANASIDEKLICA